MRKLDNKRKVALLTIGLAFVFCGFIGQLKPAQTPTVAAVVEAAPVAEKTAQQPPADPSSIADIVGAFKSPSKEESQPIAQESSEEKVFKKFVVYQDDFRVNHYALSGYMPDGKCININSFWKENCQEGGRCLQIKFDAACAKENQGWAGAYWLSPANNWASQKGGFNLTGAQKIVFWARGEEGGEVINSFKVGGIMGEEHKYPDSDEASIGPITLTKDWQEYSIDLKGKNLSYIVGGFAWSANIQENPEGMKFYIDNIYYE